MLIIILLLLLIISLHKDNRPILHNDDYQIMLMGKQYDNDNLNDINGGDLIDINGGGLININGDGSNNINGGGLINNKMQRAVARLYKKYKLPAKAPSFREFCYPTRKAPQKQQLLLGEYMHPQTANKTLMVFHEIGAGKSCVAIQIAEKWLNKHNRPLLTMPASLIPGFYDELRGFCSSKKYIDTEELSLHEIGSHKHSELIRKSNALIDKDYNIMSYNKFLTNYRKIRGAPIIIIDEFHNITNTRGTYHKAFVNFLRLNPAIRVVLMSATPIFDNITEINGIANLMRLEGELNLNNIAKMFDGKISYFAGAPRLYLPNN